MSNSTITMTGEEYDVIIARAEAAERERDELRVALDDLMSWFPEKPEWRLTAGEHGADDAVAAARAVLEAKP